MIEIMYIKSKIKKHYLVHRVANLWNSLPNDVVESKGLNQFKNNLDYLWRTQDILYEYTRDIDVTLYRAHITT